MESFEHYVPVRLLINLSERKPPISLGGTFFTNEQLGFLISDGYSGLQRMSKIKLYKPNDPTFSSVRSILFHDLLSFTFFDETTSELKNSSLDFEKGFFHMLGEAQNLIALNFTEKGEYLSLNSAELVDPVLSANVLSNHLSAVLQNIVDYVSDLYEDNKTMFLIILICSVILFPIIILIVGQVTINAQNQDGETIYNAYIAIPKNYVSAAVSRLKIQSKDIGDLVNSTKSEANSEHINQHEDQYNEYKEGSFLSLNFFDESRYGLAEDVQPFEAFSKAVQEFNIIYRCSEKDIETQTEAIYDDYHCFSSEMLFTILFGILDEAFSVHRNQKDQDNHH